MRAGEGCPELRFMHFESIPVLPVDPIFGLSSAYKADTSADKVNVGVGAYRTDEGKPWVLPVVKKVQSIVCMH